MFCTERRKERAACERIPHTSERHFGVRSRFVATYPRGGNKNVTKADIVDSLANEHELSKRQAGEIVDLILDEITTALKQGEKVQLIPFGSFVVRERKARTGRNPQTGEVLKIAARRVPAFTPGKGLKDAVGGPKRGGAKKSGRKK
jgi:DNA-binding protein HU-beta